MFTSILDSVLSESSVAPYVESFKGFTASLGQLYPVLVIALCLVVGLFGRKLSGLIRVLLLFAIGFVSSVYWAAPFIAKFVPGIPAVGLGVAVGVIAAVLSKMIYNLTYIGCIGFDVYNICFNALFLVEFTANTKGDAQLSLIFAVIAVIIALFLRKYLEMIITAAAGGIGIAFFVSTLYDFTTYFEYDPNMTKFILGGILAIPFFFIQFRNRSYI